jgi:ribosomal protein S18 acetylase RimI-like enzyme
VFEIRPLEHTDIDFAKSLTDIEGWGHRASDFRRLIELDPAGCFVAWENGERAGIATTASYDDYAFLGNVIVKKGKRGRNIGSLLMQHALRYLEERTVQTIELDGVMTAVAMYRSMGFCEKYRSLRLARKPISQYHGDRRLMSCPDAAEAITVFDHERTGIHRQRLIEKLIREFRDQVFCLASPQLEAYAVVRERADQTVAIGPIIANDVHAFSDLLSGMIDRFGNRTMTVGIPEVNTDGVLVLLNDGFEHCAPSMRMYRGSRIDYERHVYGIVSADVG